MTLLEQLQSHAGGLVKIKTQLYWYGGRGPDGNSGQVCLVLDAAPLDRTLTRGIDARVRFAACATSRTTAFLLIDGTPYWVWISEDTVELL